MRRFALYALVATFCFSLFGSLISVAWAASENPSEKRYLLSAPEGKMFLVKGRITRKRRWPLSLLKKPVYRYTVAKSIKFAQDDYGITVVGEGCPFGDDAIIVKKKNLITVKFSSRTPGWPACMSGKGFVTNIYFNPDGTMVRSQFDFRKTDIGIHISVIDSLPVDLRGVRFEKLVLPAGFEFSRGFSRRY